jgi:hypothetical protein
MSQCEHSGGKGCAIVPLCLTSHIRMPKAYTSTLLLTFLLQMSASGATYAAVPQLLNGNDAWVSSSSTRDNPKSLTCDTYHTSHTRVPPYSSRTLHVCQRLRCCAVWKQAWPAALPSTRHMGLCPVSRTLAVNPRLSELELRRRMLAGLMSQ